MVSLCEELIDQLSRCSLGTSLFNIPKRVTGQKKAGHSQNFNNLLLQRYVSSSLSNFLCQSDLTGMYNEEGKRGLIKVFIVRTGYRGKGIDGDNRIKTYKCSDKSSTNQNKIPVLNRSHKCARLLPLTCGTSIRSTMLVLISSC